MRIVCLFCFAFLFAAPALAQVSITQVQALNFGTIVADPSGDIITVRTNGSIRSSGVSDLQGGQSVATFRFEGASGATVSYSFSTGNTLTGGGQSVNIENFTTNRSNPFSLPGTGVREMSVGADMIVPAGFDGGNLSGSFVLTVDNP
jgi:hypothetical protein